MNRSDEERNWEAEIVKTYGLVRGVLYIKIFLKIRKILLDGLDKKDETELKIN